MNALFSIIWIAIIAALVGKKKGVKSGDVEKFVNTVRVSGRSKFSQLQRYAREKGTLSERESTFESDSESDLRAAVFREKMSRGSRVSTLGKLFKEDRQNDWLARQMREERKRTVWNNFSDLGAQHDAVCAADLLRREHRARHEEGVVDDGVSDN